MTYLVPTDPNTAVKETDGRHVLAMRVLLRLSKPEAHDAALGARRLDVQRELSKVSLDQQI